MSMGRGGEGGTCQSGASPPLVASKEVRLGGVQPKEAGGSGRRRDVWQTSRRRACDDRKRVAGVRVRGGRNWRWQR